ncbi:MAG: SCP2 sterol-binding domain-containing protein [Brachymonas sp.]|nr:SCP2 sterol-binding domain-containing protein [Brachymonas sp.]
MNPTHTIPNTAEAPKAFAVPASIAHLFSRLPTWPGSVAFASGVNLLLAQHMPADVAAALQGKRLRIAVRDAGVGFDFGWSGAGFVALSTSQQTPHLTITATAADFLALARREQDPDTLFFARRLVMEGDTELGLMVKNMLDAQELPVFDPRQWRLPPPSRVLGSLRAAVQPLSHRAS